MNNEATKTWRLSIECSGLEQRVKPGNSFTGEIPAADTLPMHMDRRRNTYVIDAPEASGGGLFAFSEWFTQYGKNVYVAYVQTMCAEDTGWELYLTSGFRDGTDVDIDDPVFDTLLVEGIGSSFVSIRQELLPGQCLRFKSNENTSSRDMHVLVFFATPSSEAGRLTP